MNVAPRLEVPVVVCTGVVYFRTRVGGAGLRVDEHECTLCMYVLLEEGAGVTLVAGNIVTVLVFTPVSK